MRRPTLLLFFVLAALAAGSAAPAGALGRDLFDDIYARTHGLEASLKTVTAHFTETTTTAMLSRPLVAHGTLAVIRPDRIVLRYTDPEPHVLLIDGDRMTFTWPSRGITQQSDIGAARKRVDKYFVNKTPGDLRHAFRIAAIVDRERPGTWRITMEPTRSQIKQGLSRLRLWMDRSSLLLTAMELDFPNGDTKLMTFEDVKTNAPVDPALFSIGQGSR